MCSKPSNGQVGPVRYFLDGRDEADNWAGAESEDGTPDATITGPWAVFDSRTQTNVAYYKADSRAVAAHHVAFLNVFDNSKESA